ncbi:hypothetical protein [Tessaracoccus antarcticus]|nr:hypothetical protein [Tessaracoccus antarcticus]
MSHVVSAEIVGNVLSVSVGAGQRVGVSEAAIASGFLIMETPAR